ncbi:RCC1 domain-containing protein [Cysteiniphilum litorale]|uniref:RCC1 domain-containing protein n=1 Tax=Cysteiniphilum litorale TaxID=2056700 RepID=UPI003F882A55
MSKFNYKSLYLISLATVLSACGGGGGGGGSSDPSPTPDPVVGVQPKLAVASNMSEVYMSDSSAMLEMQFMIEDVNHLQVKAASQNTHLTILSKEVVKTSLDDSSVTITAVDNSSCVINKEMAMGESCRDTWNASTSEESDQFEGKIIYNTNVGKAEAEIKLTFKSPDDPEFNLDKFNITDISPIGTGMQSNVTISNATARAINNPEIIFPAVIDSYIKNIQAPTEIKSGQSAKISFEMEDSQAALDALKQWQNDMSAHKAGSSIEYRSARFPAQAYQLQPVIYLGSLSLAVNTLSKFTEVNGKLEATVSVLNVSGQDIAGINTTMMQEENAITIDTSSCRFPLSANNSCLLKVIIDPDIAKGDVIQQHVNITLSTPDVIHRDHTTLAINIDSKTEVALSTESTLLANYNNQIALSNTRLINWVVSKHIEDYRIVDEAGNDVTSRFELSGGIKAPSCLTVTSLSKGQSCYLSVKPLANETGKRLFLKLLNTNANPTHNITLPDYSDSGVYPSVDLNPDTVVKNKDLSLYFTIAPPVNKTFVGFELVGVNKVTQDVAYPNSCISGALVSADNPCQLKLDISGDEVNTPHFNPELIIHWQDSTQTTTDINIKVVDPTQPGEDVSGLADLYQLDAAFNYVDINVDNIVIYIKNTTGKVLSNFQVEILPNWLSELIDTSSLTAMTLTNHQNVTITLPLKSGKTANDLVAVLESNMSDLANNAQTGVDGGKVVRFTASNSVNDYRPELIVDTFPHIVTPSNETVEQSLNQVMVFGKPSVKHIVINNPTSDQYTMSFDQSLPIESIIRVTTGGVNGLANCSEFTTLLAGESCALIVEAKVDAYNTPGNYLDVMMTPINSPITTQTKLHIKPQINYVYFVSYEPSEQAIEIPYAGDKHYDLQIYNDEIYIHWLPSTELADYVISHKDGAEGLTITTPEQTPSCLDGAPVATNEYCYIGLSVNDMAVARDDYDLTLKMGQSNLAVDSVDISYVAIIDHGVASVSVEKGAQVISKVVPNSSIDVVIRAPQGWQDQVIADQSYTVTANNSGMTFPKGNQCTLLRSQPEAACRVEVHIAESMVVGEYELTIVPNTATTVPLSEAVVIKALQVINEQFQQISAGLVGTCALNSVGQAYCWGRDTYGFIGDGTPEQDKYQPTPVKMPDSVVFTAIESNWDFSCALGSDNNAYCWGRNDYGQLGDGSTTSKYQPTLVKMPTGVNFTAVSLGGSYACALGDDNNAYCWGYNRSGQLGDGSIANKYQPTLVKMPIGVSFTAMSLGYAHACALGNDNNAYCWGSNGTGQLGNGSTAARAQPILVTKPNGVSFTAISVGSYHACALGGDNNAYCWGRNNSGELGDGSTFDKYQPTLVKKPNGVSFTAVFPGGAHTCALGDDNNAYCWGSSDYGRLGNGSGANKFQPILVKMPTGVSFTTMSVGSAHACALGDDNHAYCWGWNDFGQLGNGTNNSSSIPVAVKMPE